MRYQGKAAARNPTTLYWRALGNQRNLGKGIRVEGLIRHGEQASKVESRKLKVERQKSKVGGPTPFRRTSKH